MYDAILANLNNKAGEFGAIERQVNESSRLRKIHSEEAIALIRQSMEVGDILGHEFEIISRANRTMRDRDATVLNYCTGLETNICRQKEQLGVLMKEPGADASALSRLGEMIDALAVSLRSAIVILRVIVQNDADIVLMDDLVIHRRKIQRESIDRLKKLTLRTIQDADAAIRGSSSNLKRGLQMIERLKEVRRLIDERRADDLAALIEEANAGWNTAASVNRSSITQMVFAEEVNRLTENLHAESSEIRELVFSRHPLFARNLELMGELAVHLSHGIKDFLPARDLAGEMLAGPGPADNVRGAVSSLVSYVHIACRDIGAVSGMNFDMTEAIALNSGMEKKAIELTKMKIGYFERIREEVRSMTDATSYPIEGSGRNIENGKILEMYLRQILGRISGGDGPARAP